MDKEVIMLTVFQTLIAAFGGGYVTEDVIRDTKKIVHELFGDGGTQV